MPKSKYMLAAGIANVQRKDTKSIINCSRKTKGCSGNKIKSAITTKCAMKVCKIIAYEHSNCSTFQFGPYVTDPNEIWRSYREKSWE